MPSILPGITLAAAAGALMVTVVFLQHAKDILKWHSAPQIWAWIAAGIWSTAAGLAVIAAALTYRRVFGGAPEEWALSIGWSLALLGLHLLFAAWRSTYRNETPLPFFWRFGLLLIAIVVFGTLTMQPAGR